MPDKSAITANSSAAMCSAISDAAELVQLFMSTGIKERSILQGRRIPPKKFLTSYT